MNRFTGKTTRCFLTVFVASMCAIASPRAAQYEDCIASMSGDLDDALEQGLTWKESGGGAAAEHCVALILLAMGHHEDAALRLENLALEPGAGGKTERAEILAQAAQAWMQAERPSEADVDLTSAIDLRPGDAGLYVDRALTHGVRQDWTSAITDLTAAIELDRSLVDAYVLRASARRESGDVIGAAADVNRALELDPENVDALLERGRQRELAAGRDPAVN